MNTHHHNPEELLARGKDASLSASERSDMKVSLMDYARFHGAKAVAPQPSFFSPLFWSRVAVAAAFVFVVTGTTGYASLQSVPGDMLYGVKTNVVEEAVGALQFTSESRLEYASRLLEERYAELQELRTEDALTPALLTEIAAGMDTQLGDIEAVVAEGDEADAERILMATAEASALTRAAARLVAAEGSDQFEEVNDAATGVHMGRLADLIATGDATEVNLYIQAQLAEIDAELGENDLSAMTTEQVDAYLDDTAEALEAGDIDGAVRRANDAVQAILTEEYVSDFEDEVEE